MKKTNRQSQPFETAAPAEGMVFTYLNVESQLTATDVGGWRPEQMRMAVATTLSGHRLRIFDESRVGELGHFLRTADYVVGYNLIGFDFRVLSAYSEIVLSAPRFVDLKTEIERAAGTRVVLTDVAEATLQIEPFAISVEIPAMWKNGQLKDVAEACCNRTLAIRALHEFGRAKEYVFVKTPTGRRKCTVKW